MQTAETVSPTPERAAKGQVRQVPTDKAGVFAHQVIESSDLIGCYVSIVERMERAWRDAQAYRLSSEEVTAARDLQSLWDATGIEGVPAHSWHRVDRGYEEGPTTPAEAAALDRFRRAMRRIPSPAMRESVFEITILNRHDDKHMANLRAGLRALAKSV